MQCLMRCKKELVMKTLHKYLLSFFYSIFPSAEHYGLDYNSSFPIGLTFPRFLPHFIQTTYSSFPLNLSSKIPLSSCHLNHRKSSVSPQSLSTTCWIKSKLLSLTLEVVHNLAATQHPIFTSTAPQTLHTQSRYLSFNSWPRESPLSTCENPTSSKLTSSMTPFLMTPIS